MEVVEDSEDEGEVVHVPAPRLSTWEGPGHLVPIIDQMILNFMAGNTRDQRQINKEFMVGTLQAEETARRDLVPKYRGDNRVPAYRESPEL